MSYLFLAFVALIFVFGWGRSKQLLGDLSNVDRRQNLLLRIGGFILMSAWLHALPSVLLTIYMRREGILATEVLGDDSARAVAATLYSIVPIVAVVACLCSGAIFYAFESKGLPPYWRWLSSGNHLSFGVVVGLGLIWVIADGNGGWQRAVFVLAVAAPFAGYLTVALVTPLETQIKHFWIPFAVVGFVTFFLFFRADVTHDLVGDELTRFGSGGGNMVFVTNGEEELLGLLILVTHKAVYLKEIDDGLPKQKPDPTCQVRIPIDHATVTSLPSRAFLRKSRMQVEGIYIAKQVPAPVQERFDTAFRKMGERCSALIQPYSPFSTLIEPSSPVNPPASAASR